MPISEDEYERQRPNQSTMSKAEQRRNNKPIMEKRRRARINQCLNELKSLILDAMKKDPARHSKLEKADILEMTVKHLQTLQRQQLAVAVATDPNVLHKFKTGFNECAGEVSRYIGNIDNVETGVKQRLVAHLSNCVTGLQQPSPFTFSGANNSSGTNTNTIPITISQGNNTICTSSTIPSGAFNGDVNNNQNTTRIQVPPGIQLIPSRLPTGELALLVPNSTNMPFFSSSVISGSNITTCSPIEMNNQITSNSAFTTVRPSKHSDSLKMTSPPLSPASSTTSYDDHSVSESFHRPRTPSPKEVTISFPTPPGSLHHRSAFKPSTVLIDQSPPQQFQITSTSFSPENNSEYGLKIEYKAVPIYQPQEKSYKSFSNNKSMEPLSVITSDKSKILDKENYHHHQSSKVDNSRIYMNRKRAHPNDGPEGLLVVANHDPQPSTSKYARYSLDDVSTTSSASSSGSPDQRFSVESHFHQPSTSGYGNNQQGDANNEHMWRPW